MAPAFQYESQRAQRGEFDGEPIMMMFVTHRGREALEVVMRFDEQEGRIARIRAYGFCPDTIRAIGEGLSVARPNRNVLRPHACAGRELARS